LMCIRMRGFEEEKGIIEKYPSHNTNANRFVYNDHT
jgi:hypothetical protein